LSFLGVDAMRCFARDTFEELYPNRRGVFESPTTSQPDEIVLTFRFLIEIIRVHEKVAPPNGKAFWSKVFLLISFTGKRVNPKNMTGFPAYRALYCLQQSYSIKLALSVASSA
jgi:hypothetical protein